MHLHGHEYWLLNEGPGRWDRHTIINPSNPLRRDTHNLRPNGYMVLQYTADNPGVWPFHCHIAWHLSTVCFCLFVCFLAWLGLVVVRSFFTFFLSFFLLFSFPSRPVLVPSRLPSSYPQLICFIFLCSSEPGSLSLSSSFSSPTFTPNSIIARTIGAGKAETKMES